MGAPVSLLANARAFARDYARDTMPPGYLWDVWDFVPAIIDTNLTGRGAWRWGSVDTGSGDPEVGTLATFKEGDQLLIQTTGGHLVRVNPDTYAVTDLGASPRGAQNPVQLGETVVHFDGNGAAVPQLWRNAGPVNGDFGGKHPRVGTVWKSAVISGGATGEESVIRYSVAGADLATAAAYDANAFDTTSGRVTALQAMRSVVLIFHPSSVERLRGSVFPNTAAAEEGDLFIEGLFDRIGCKFPKSIAIWNDNCIFADEHGVHMTDGAIVRTLTTLGGISYFWRLLYENAVSVAGTVFLDYYVITVRKPLLPPITLICDLNRRQWFRFMNIDALCYIAAGGSVGMERVWAGIASTNRLARIGPTFYPDPTIAQIDDNLVPVNPGFETAWYRLGQEGRKRARFVYLSYDLRCFSATAEPLIVSYITSPENPNYTIAGGLPETERYTRYRLPLQRFPYGIAFAVHSTGSIGALRIYGLAIEAAAAERSRV